MLTAAALVIGFHVHTFHFDSQRDVPAAFRNTDSTPGLYIRTESGLTAGIARNSLRRTSFYLAKTWTTDDGRWGLTAGGITGYKYQRHTGQHACMKGLVHSEFSQCWYEHGASKFAIRPLIAPSWAWIEARPYLGGATPRVVLLGKGVNLAIEAEF